MSRQSRRRTEVDPGDVRAIEGVGLGRHGPQAQADDVVDLRAAIAQPNLIARRISWSRRLSRVPEADPRDLGAWHRTTGPLTPLTDTGLKGSRFPGSVAPYDHVGIRCRRCRRHGKEERDRAVSASAGQPQPSRCPCCHGLWGHPGMIAAATGAPAGGCRERRYPPQTVSFTGLRRFFRCSCPTTCRKVKVLDLSQNFSADSPAFAFYEGPTVKWVKRIAFEGVNAQYIASTNHIATHLDSPIHFYDPGPDIAGIPIETLFGPACIVDLDAVRDRRLPDLRPRALRGLGEEERHHRSSAATSWSSTPATTASTTRTGTSRWPARSPACRTAGPTRSTSPTCRAPSCATPARRAASPSGCSTAASAGWPTTASPPTTRSTPTCARPART